MTTMEKLELAKTIQAHFPDAPDADVRLVCDACDGLPLKACQTAVEQHRLDLGVDVYRPSPNALAYRASRLAGVVTDGVAMTDAYRQQQRAFAGQCKAEYDRADELIAGYEPDDLKPLVVEFIGELKTGMLTPDVLGCADPATGQYLADLYRRKPQTRGFRLMLAAWLRRRAA